MRRDDERLQDILDAITAIERYLQQGQPAFEAQELIQVWVAHHLQMIGEAATALSPDLTATYPSSRPTFKLYRKTYKPRSSDRNQKHALRLSKRQKAEVKAEIRRQKLDRLWGREPMILACGLTPFILHPFSFCLTVHPFSFCLLPCSPFPLVQLPRKF